MASVAFLGGLIGRCLGSRRILFCVTSRPASTISAARGLGVRSWAMLPRRGACARLGRYRSVQPGNGLADQAFNSVDRLVVDRSDDRDCRTGTSGATGTTNTVHVIVCVMRHVEIEHMTDLGNVETPGGDVRCDQQFGFAATKSVECRHARGLIHIAVQCDGIEFVTEQGAMEVGNLALAIAENDSVLETGSRAHQAT